MEETKEQFYQRYKPMKVAFEEYWKPDYFGGAVDKEDAEVIFVDGYKAGAKDKMSPAEAYQYAHDTAKKLLNEEREQLKASERAKIVEMLERDLARWLKEPNTSKTSPQ